MSSEGLEICKRLESLIPELCHSQETHRIWRDCGQEHRDANPSIGDKDFHDNMVQTYQTRIDTIVSAIMYISENQPLLPLSEDFVTRCKSLLKGVEVDLDKPLSPDNY